MFLKQKFRKNIIGAGCLFFHATVYGALPTPVAPTTTPADGNWLSFMEGWANDVGTTAALVISMVSFIIVAWSLAAKFNQVRQPRPAYSGKRSVALGLWKNSRTPVKGASTWADIGVHAIVGGILLVINAYLLNEVIGVI